MWLGEGAELHPDAPRYKGGVTRSATEWNTLCRGNLDRMVTDTKQLLVQGMHLGNTADEMATGQVWIHPALSEVVEQALLKLIEAFDSHVWLH